jgi:hypothetical protein
MAAGLWIYPALEAAAAVIDHHDNLYPSNSKPAEHGFTRLAPAHCLPISRTAEQGRSALAYGSGRFYRVTTPGIAPAIFPALCQRCFRIHISDADDVIWSKQVPPQIHISFWVFLL